MTFCYFSPPSDELWLLEPLSFYQNVPAASHVHNNRFLAKLLFVSPLGFPFGNQHQILQGVWVTTPITKWAVTQNLACHTMLTPCSHFIPFHYFFIMKQHLLEFTCVPHIQYIPWRYQHDFNRGSNRIWVSIFLQISDVGNGQSDKKQGMTKKVGSEYLF